MSNQFTWTDDAVKQFARVYAAGRTGKYKKARKIDDKLNIFKQIGLSAVSSKTRKRGRPSKTLLIDRQSFLIWYLSDDVIEDFASTYGIRQGLINNGRFSISAKELLCSCGYLPVEVVHHSMQKNIKKDENDEVDMSYYTIYKFAKP